MIQAAAKVNRTDALLVSISYLSFIILGMPAAILGVASPSIRSSFELSLDAIGALFISSTVGYFLGSSYSGRLIAHLGIARLLVASSLVTGVGLIGYTLTPTWPLMVALGLVAGTGGGFIDAGMNIYFAANYGPRLMNWLHACFGIGSTLGPLMMTEILRVGGGNNEVWRWGYVITAALYALLAVLFFVTRTQWVSARSDTPSGDASSSARATLRLPLVWIGIILFVFYAGQESVPGQWAYSLLTEVRGITAETAGIWVSIYWASFTAGRIVFGVIVSWMNPQRLIRLCMLGSLVGAALFWWNPANMIGSGGLALFGFALAPIFALLITSTQERLGPVHAPNAIGFQVAAASVGFGILPGVTGVLAQNLGLEIVGPFLLALTVGMVILYEVSLRVRVQS